MPDMKAVLDAPAGSVQGNSRGSKLTDINGKCIKNIIDEFDLVLLNDCNGTFVNPYTGQSSPLGLTLAPHLQQRGVNGGSTRIVWGVALDKKDDVLGLQGQFDVVVCADCLFLDDYRACLVQTIDDLLKPCGTALVFSPRRGKTLELFCELARCCKFCIEKTQIYDEEVWEKHCKMQANGEKIYDEDLHYPYMLTLRKASSCSIEKTAH
uniref:calmodulin-lysine N-methyltransferase-like n=1 Tax=Myxine glutinosa TaxID=7769 RepID=UPI00358F5813